MPERDIRLRILVEDKNLAALRELKELLQGAAAAERQLSTDATRKNKAITTQAKAVKKGGKEVRSLSERTKEWTRSIVRNIGKVMEWAVATGLVYGSLQLLRTAIKDVMDVEFAMAGLTKVMEDGRTRSRLLRSELLALGHQYGELGDSVIDAATEWARLQLSTFEIAQNAENALLAQAVAEMEVTQASKYLIASMQQFDLTTLANIRTLDQWNELSNRMAVRTLDLAQSSARAGSVLHNAGDEMAYLNAMTAALVQATGRSGQEIGNAIRTMGTYIFRVRTLGVLQEQGGIQVQNAAGQHKRFSNIISELAVQWNTYSDAVRRQIGQSVAGTRRTNEFMTLMREYPEVLNAAVIAWESMGSAQKESEILLDTAQKKAEQLRSGMQRLAAELIDSRGFKAMLDILNGLINALIEAREIIALFAGAVTLLGVKALWTSGAVAKLGLAIKSLAISHPILLALVAATVAATAAYSAFHKEVQDTTDAMVELSQKNLADVKATEARINRLKVLTDMYRTMQEARQKAVGWGEPTTEIDRNLEITAKQIQSAMRDMDRGFIFDSAKWRSALLQVSDAVDQLTSKMETSRTTGRSSTRANVESLRTQIKFVEEYIKALERQNRWEGDRIIRTRAFYKALVKSNTYLDEMKAILKDTAFMEESVFGDMFADAQRADEFLKKLNVTLNEQENILSSLDVPKSFLDSLKQAAMDADELRRFLFEVSLELAAIDERYRHQGAMAKLAGADEADAAQLVIQAITEKIAALEKNKKEVLDNEKATGKLQAQIDKLGQALETANNRFIESDLVDFERNLRKELSDTISIMKEKRQIYIDVARARKDNVQVAEREITLLEDERVEVRRVIRAFKDNNIEVEDLEQREKLLTIAINNKRKALEGIIEPQQRGNRARERAKENEKAFQQVIADTQREYERIILTMRDSGATEEQIARVRDQMWAAILKDMKRFNVELDTSYEIDQQILDVETQIALLRQRSLRETGLRAIQEYSRELQRLQSLIQAAGADEIQLAEFRREAIIEEARAVAQSTLTWQEKEIELRRLHDDMQDAVNDLAVAEIEAARRASEAWIKEYERRRAAWERLIGRAISKGVAKADFMEQFERIRDRMVERWAAKAFAPMIDKLTQWEEALTGAVTNEMRQEEINRQKMLQAMRTGGTDMQLKIARGGRQAANDMYRAIISASGRGGARVAPPIPHPPEMYGPPVPPVEAGGGAGAGGYGLLFGMDIASQAPDWFGGRGGGYRGLGYGAGAGIGLAVGGPMGAYIGAQIGQQVVGAIQDAIRGADIGTPGEESLRDQIGGTMAQGAFGSAAQITNYIENNITMQYMIPDQEQVRQIVAILRPALESNRQNVEVS